MNNADKFKSAFGLYATEVWAMPEKEFIEWLHKEDDGHTIEQKQKGAKMGKLKPCPFCGGEAVIWKSQPLEIGKIIECQDCDVRVAVPWAVLNTQAAQAWNRRSDGEKL
jgi:Lar family restriction alleviation protein